MFAIGSFSIAAAPYVVARPVVVCSIQSPRRSASRSRILPNWAFVRSRFAEPFTWRDRRRCNATNRACSPAVKPGAWNMRPSLVATEFVTPRSIPTTAVVSGTVRAAGGVVKLTVHRPFAHTIRAEVAAEMSVQAREMRNRTHPAFGIRISPHRRLSRRTARSRTTNPCRALERFLNVGYPARRAKKLA
jgi:hypothetical protein